jgi:hypothetical protein
VCQGHSISLPPLPDLQPFLYAEDSGLQAINFLPELPRLEEIPLNSPYTQFRALSDYRSCNIRMVLEVLVDV